MTFILSPCYVVANDKVCKVLYVCRVHVHNNLLLYPTYDIDQSTTSVYIKSHKSYLENIMVVALSLLVFQYRATQSTIVEIDNKVNAGPSISPQLG